MDIESHIGEFYQRGGTAVPDVIDQPTVVAARAIAMRHMPRASSPSSANGRQWDGRTQFPYATDLLSHLVVDLRVIRCVKSLLECATPRLVCSTLWVKKAGHADYDQPFHVDFPEHTLLVPQRRRPYRAAKGYLYLTDVADATGATRLVSTTDRKLVARQRWFEGEEFAALHQSAVPAEGSAGSILFMSPNFVHRGAALERPKAVRVTLSFSYTSELWPWTARSPWLRTVCKRSGFVESLPLNRGERGDWISSARRSVLDAINCSWSRQALPET